MRKALLALVTFTVTGCDVLGGGPLEGVWMFEAPSPEANCNTAWSTNLRSASIGGQGNNAWSDIDEHEQSLDIFFARISHGRADDAVMVVGDDVIPGSKIDGDTWEFTYVATLMDRDGRTHNSGYAYEEVVDNEINTVYTITRENNRWLSGTANFDSRFTETWTETDRWNDTQTGLYYGEIPAYEVGATDNYATENDCLDRDCFITRETRCENSVGLVGTWTGLDGEGQFELDDNYTSAVE
ncbi:MAG: hypothetical protein H6737_10930 [Alphaproteobacteria bacterium]|nr:hypothetical protein [Alphaproteobacteria bacterium]